MVELVEITKSYNENKVIDNLSYSFKEKGLYRICGESGCGKTTLLNLISKRIKIDKGKVNLSDECFFLSLNDYLINNFTVEEIIELHQDLFKNFKFIKELDIEQLMKKKISKLSLGEKQRVGLILAFSSNCKIILLDEPIASLDNKYRTLALNLMKKESKKRLIIFVSHQNYKIKKCKNLNLKNGKIIEKSKLENINDFKPVKKLNKQYKWGFFLHIKQIVARVIFVICILNVFVSYKFINTKLNDATKEFNLIYKEGNVYYKENNKKLTNQSFYQEIVLSLAKEIKGYSQGFYSEEMYEGIITIDDKYFDNGFLFSHVNLIEGLDENEVIINLDFENFCRNNNYTICLKEQLKLELIGKRLIYSYKGKNFSLIIKEINEGENQIFTSDSLILDEVKKLHSDQNYLMDYQLMIDNEYLERFYFKINTNDNLLNYSFIELDHDEKYTYFLVKDSDRVYFNFNDINDNSIACLDIGFSCNSFEFSKFKSLVYIDSLSTNNEVYYNLSKVNLDYDEIIISSKLSSMLNKSIGDYLDLRFYFDDHFHNLEKVKIVDVIEDSRIVIYHNKYDYKLFLDKFNKGVRVDYLYSESELIDCKKENLFYSEVIEDAKEYIVKMLNFINCCLIIIFGFIIFILFLIEINKFKRNYEFYRLLKYYKVNLNNLLLINYLFYVLVGVTMLFNIWIWMIYYLCLFNYVLKIKKLLQE